MSEIPYHNASTYGENARQVIEGGGDPHKAMLYENNKGENLNGQHAKVGEVQPKKCNDCFWAVLFFANLGAIAWVTAWYAPQFYEIASERYSGGYDKYSGGRRGLEDDGGGGVGGNNYNPYTYATVSDIIVLIAIVGFLSLVTSGLALGLMMKFANGLIKTALVFSIFSTLLMVILGFVSGQIYVAIMGLMVFGFTVYYAWMVWDRIPFAACNLTTAVAAVRANIGVTFFAYLSLAVLFAWNLWFALAFASYVGVKQYSIEDAGEEDGGEIAYQQDPTFGIIVFLLVLSYYWTHQVVKNHLHVTVAGTVGTWWFAPLEASCCCSSAVTGSFFRASTFSFGSICFGSLIVAIIQALKESLHHAREEGGDSCVLCLAECLLGCIESLAEYFNQWAYVYVGLYGYSFLEAGKNVMTLFKERGWTTIITDNLIDRVLVMMSFVIGLIMGCVAVAIAQMKGMLFNDDVTGNLVPFFIGTMIGFMLTAVLMNVVGSAVNTVIVCYAEAPNEFQMNHPQYSNEMRQAWKQAWPVDFTY